MPEETRQTDAPEPRELRQRQRTKSPVSDSIEEKLNESDDSDDAQQDNDDLSESDENEPSFDKDKISIILKPNVNESSGSKPKVSTKSNSLIVTVIVVPSIIFALILLNFFKNPSSSIYETINWRLKINSYANLSDNQRSTISASLKPILDKSINPQSTLSTLLILSSDENKAAQLARCLLHIVNAVQSRNQISTELNFENYGNNKLQLDTDLETLLRPDDTIRAVVLRRVDILSSLNAFEQLRLLFAYCDGENPKISDRLIIMTAASVPPMESRIRDEFKNRWPREHDFIDALMSRISGHTLQIDQHQTLFCN